MQPNAARPAEFDAALLAHMPALKGMAHKYVPARNREEVVQDVVIYTLAHWENFRPANGAPIDQPSAYHRGSGFYTWLYWQFRSVTANWRRVTNVRRALDRKYQLREKPYECGARKSRGETRYPLGSFAAPQEQALAARDSIERLPGRGGAVLIKRAAGYDQREIAADMGLTHQRVSQIEIAAREKLKVREEKVAA